MVLVLTGDFSRLSAKLEGFWCKELVGLELDVFLASKRLAASSLARDLVGDLSDLAGDLEAPRPTTVLEEDAMVGRVEEGDLDTRSLLGSLTSVDNFDLLFKPTVDLGV